MIKRLSKVTFSAWQLRMGMSSMPESTLTLLLFVLSLIAFALPTLVETPVLLNAVIIDDAFYYLKTAWHISRGLGSTFDGIHPTNGYHPLWMLLLAPLYKIFSGGGETPVRLALFLQAFLGAAGTVVLYQTLCLGFQRLTAALVAIVWITWNYRFLINGLETPLYALLLISTIYCWAKYFQYILRSPVGRHYFLLGMLLGITCLARLDGVFVAAAFAFAILLDLWQRRLRPFSQWRNLLAFGMPFLALLVPYLLSNYLIFGNLFPVSGATKLGWRATQDSYQASPVIYVGLVLWPLLEADRILLLGLVVAPVLYLVCRVGQQGRDWGAKCLSPWLPLMVAGIALHLFYVVAFLGPHSKTAWYFVPQRVMAAATMAAMIEIATHVSKIKTQLSGLSESIAFGISLIGAWGTGFSMLRIAILASGLMVWAILSWKRVAAVRYQWVYLVAIATLLIGLPLLSTLRTMSVPIAIHSPYLAYQGALWLRNNTDEDAIAAAWNAGIIGYYSHRRVINLDGLANSSDYAERVRGKGLGHYLVNEGTDYLVDCLDWDPRAILSLPTEFHIEEISVPASSLVAQDNGCRLYIYRFTHQKP